MRTTAWIRAGGLRPNKPMVPTAPASPAAIPPRPLRRHIGQSLDARRVPSQSASSRSKVQGDESSGVQKSSESPQTEKSDNGRRCRLISLTTGCVFYDSGVFSPMITRLSVTGLSLQKLLSYDLFVGVK
jgi:hypothetical protein